MTLNVPIRLILVDPPPAVDFGIQRGRGARYETLLVQQAKGQDVAFDFAVSVNEKGKDGLPNFTGPFVQGPPAKRFVYIDVGTYAGQKGTPWSRRMIVPLGGITWVDIKRVLSRDGQRLVAKIPGTAKDGGPNCATVQLIGDWRVMPS